MIKSQKRPKSWWRAVVEHYMAADSFDTGSPWYVAHTKPRQEFTAVANLQRQGYKTYVPMLYRSKKRRGHWERIEEVCFPRYVFFSPGSPRQGLATVRSSGATPPDCEPSLVVQALSALMSISTRVPWST